MNSGHEAVIQAYCQSKNYSFLGPIGGGAFKSVFLVRIGTQDHAIKVMNRGLSDARSEREIQFQLKCDHQHIAKVHNVELLNYGNEIFTLLHEEFLAGGTLQSRVPPGSILTPEQVRELAFPLANTIEFLHSAKFVHRDIKPANILFRDESLTPVLTDFGIARALDEPSLTRDFVGMGPGTPAYAAPEQLRNDKAMIDWRTDQFGLSVVLSECLLGHHPFAEAIGGQHQNHAINLVHQRSPLPSFSVSKLEAVGFGNLIKALNPWPICRYNTTQAFIESFQS